MTDESLIAASRLTDLLRAPDAKPVFLTGAGISLASGIATFRGTDPDAVWANEVLEKGTLRYFYDDPVGSWEFYLARFDGAREAKPNPAHEAIVDIERKRPGTIVITQNVDGLHATAGTKNLIEIHGAARKMRCSKKECVNGAPRGFLEWDDSFFSKFRENPSFENIPRCPVCRKPIRAHVLWFDEHYLDHEDYGMERAHRATFDWTVLVFVGTSHSVGITYTALEAAENDGIPIFNIDPVGANYEGIVDIKGKAEEVLPTLARSIE